MAAGAADQARNPRSLRRRRFWTPDEKQRMVAESLAPCASVATVAQRNGVNANLLFTWRRQGATCASDGRAKPVALVPVTVAVERAPAAPIATPPADRMEIVLVGGERIVVSADVDASARFGSEV
jgi:transposase